MGSGVGPLAVATRLSRPPQDSGRQTENSVRRCWLLSSVVRLLSSGTGVPGDLRMRVREGSSPKGCAAAPGWRLPLHAGGVAVPATAGIGIERVRAISTGRLHGLLRFHLRPIDVVVFHGSRRDLVLRGASRLDAFSGYPVRT
jgi:hypothetical protein